MENSFSYRFYQIISLLLGTRIISLSLMLFALYVSTYFVFNQEENLRQFIFDFKIHSIIACAMLSIAAGGIINQYYDKEKDKVMKPFVFKFQHFLKEKYFLYLYIALNVFSIIISLFCSWQIFIFFIFYQFLIWLYSHKLNRILLISNLSFVGVLMYPFFGILVYYHHISYRLVLLALFLFLILFLFDVIKDLISFEADELLNYKTLPTYFGIKFTKFFLLIIILILLLICFIFINKIYTFGSMFQYFRLCIIFFTILIIPIFWLKKSNLMLSLNLIRLFLFIGFTSMMIKDW